MSAVQDLATAIEELCNRDGMRLDAPTLERMTPTCSLIERAQVIAALPMWAQRQIERHYDDIIAKQQSRRPAA